MEPGVECLESAVPVRLQLKRFTPFPVAMTAQSIETLDLRYSASWENEWEK
jgi:hypothetical protein